MHWLKKAFGHTKTILRHKYYVFKWCRKFGLTWAGITHDLSKFHPTEWLEGVKYYNGQRSPIKACKEANGFSYAWFHHRGNNKHHYEMWVDDFDHGGKALVMPLRYVLELFCDYMGAFEAYSRNAGKEPDIKDEVRWWLNKRKTCKMHPQTIRMVDWLFYWIVVGREPLKYGNPTLPFLYEVIDVKKSEFHDLLVDFVNDDANSPFVEYLSAGKSVNVSGE